MEPNGAGSPDSGYRSSCSPNSLQSEVVNTKAKNRASLSQTEHTSTTNNEVLTESETFLRTSDQLNDKLVSTSSFGNNKKLDSCLATNSKQISKRSPADPSLGSRIKHTCSDIKRRPRIGRQKFVEEENSSPVLGIRILPIEAVKKSSSQSNESSNSEKMKTSNIVVTKQPGQGAFVCRLCSETHENAMALAQHKCVRIVNERYACLECKKSFGCPANLASHKRWHKPKDVAGKAIVVNLKSSEPVESNPENSNLLKTSPEDSEITKNMTTVSSGSLVSCTGQRVQKAIYPCPVCKRRFRRDSNRRKHAHVKHQLTLAPHAPGKKEKTRNASADNNSSRRSPSPDDRATKSLRGNIQTPQDEKIFDNRYGINDYYLKDIAQVSTTPVVQPQHGFVRKSFQQKNFFPFQRLNSEEMNNQNEEAQDLSIRKRKRNEHSSSLVSTCGTFPANEVPEAVTDSSQPLDLSLKTSKRAKLRHSIAEITKPASNDVFKDVKTQVSSAAKDRSDFILNYSLSKIRSKYGPPPLLYQGSGLLKAIQPSVRWPAASNSLLHDFYHASAFNSDRYVALSPYRI